MNYKRGIFFLRTLWCYDFFFWHLPLFKQAYSQSGDGQNILLDLGKLLRWIKNTWAYFFNVKKENPWNRIWTLVGRSYCTTGQWFTAVTFSLMLEIKASCAKPHGQKKKNKVAFTRTQMTSVKISRIGIVWWMMGLLTLRSSWERQQGSHYGDGIITPRASWRAVYIVIIMWYLFFSRFRSRFGELEKRSPERDTGLPTVKEQKHWFDWLTQETVIESSGKMEKKYDVKLFSSSSV